MATATLLVSCSTSISVAEINKPGNEVSAYKVTQTAQSQGEALNILFTRLCPRVFRERLLGIQMLLHYYTVHK